jgi:hypothetical protein
VKNTARLLAVSALLLMAPIGSVVGTGPAGADITRKVYVSATGLKGEFVTDLTAAEISVKEGGKACPVASLQPATAPIEVAILVDDLGSGGFQAAVGQFLQKSLGHGQVAISLLNLQAMKIVDFTEDVDALKTALARLGQRGRLQPDGDQLPSAIADSARALRQRKAERPVIVVFTIAGSQPHSVDPGSVIDGIRMSGAGLNVVHLPRADLGQIMGDGAKQSGGRTEEGSTSESLAAAATKIADMLQHQYVLTYTLPAGVKMSDRIAVATSRKGIELTAPSRIAAK